VSSGRNFSLRLPDDFNKNGDPQAAVFTASKILTIKPAAAG